MHFCRICNTRCCNVPKLDVCEHLTNYQYAALTISFRANQIKSIRFMYFFVSVINICHKIFIRGTDMNVASFAVPFWTPSLISH